MDDLRMPVAATPARPFPETDYDKHGKLRPVRGRVLKKLLKYEFKAYLLPLLIATAAVIGTAIVVAILGFFVTVEDIHGDGELARFLFWILAFLIFICGLVFLCLFPLILAAKRYNKQFFTSEGYLTLSIPASPEEHVFAKRIAAYAMTLAASLVAFVALVIAVLPVLRLLEVSDGSLGIVETDGGSGFWNGLYFILSGLVSPLLLLGLCGGYSCWKHRGLKSWMVALIVIGLYLLSAIVSVVFGGVVFELELAVLDVLGVVGQWVGLALQCLAVWLLFLYETQTLRKKINLK